MDYLGVIWGWNMRKSAIVANMQDGLSSIFVVVTHVLRSYTGHFNVIVLCTASYVMGLLLFRISEDMAVFCGAVTLIAFGSASQPSAFLRYQMKEKVRKSRRSSRQVNSEDQNIERETRSEHQNGGSVGKENREIDSELQNQDDNKYRREIKSANGNRDVTRDEITEISSENQNPDENRDGSRESRGINPEHQNRDGKRREISSQHENGGQSKEEKRINLNSTLWIISASICGALFGISFTADNESQWKNPFNVATMFMVVAYLFFYSGCFCYSFEDPCGSPLYKIYRVFVAALWKWKLEYPDSEEGYYWKNQKPNFHFSKNGKIRLRPRVPKIWRWLDKAAIKGVEVEFTFSPEELEKQGKNGEICTVKEVREVKRFSSLMHMSFTFWPFSLTMASANTFFVEQAGTLKPDFHINGLFIISSCVSYAVSALFKLKILTKHKQGITIVRIGAGMVCAVLCCFTASRLELHRLSLTRKEGIVGSRDRHVSMSMTVLIPQFLLLGLMEGLVQGGLEKFYSRYVPESMKGFAEPFTEFVFGTGKLLTLPCLLIFRAWFTDSINTSHLDKYFLMLAILNIVALGWFVYYSLTYAYKEPYPNDEELVKEYEQGQGEVD